MELVVVVVLVSAIPSPTFDVRFSSESRPSSCATVALVVVVLDDDILLLAAASLSFLRMRFFFDLLHAIRSPLLLLSSSSSFLSPHPSFVDVRPGLSMPAKLPDPVVALSCVVLRSTIDAFAIEDGGRGGGLDGTAAVTMAIAARSVVDECAASSSSSFASAPRWDDAGRVPSAGDDESIGGSRLFFDLVMTSAVVGST